MFIYTNMYMYMYIYIIYTLSVKLKILTLQIILLKRVKTNIFYIFLSEKHFFIYFTNSVSNIDFLFNLILYNIYNCLICKMSS